MTSQAGSELPVPHPSPSADLTETLVWGAEAGEGCGSSASPSSHSPGPFVSGQVVAQRFRILREIGQGGMGVVYEALDLKRNQRIAIKAAKPGFHKYLSPELEGALRVRHPNVCLVNEIHTAPVGEDTVDFLTMELLEGETLACWLLAGRKPSASEAVAIGRQLCAGLAEAHRIGILHRDLKPANVIVCPAKAGEWRAVITDFGLSGEAAFPDEVRGTPGYMAPELWQGSAASRASDIYALGVILRDMDTAQRTPRAYRSLAGQFLSSDPRRRLNAFAQAQRILRRAAHRAAWSRRQLLACGLGAVLAAAAGGLWLERDKVAANLADLLHPLPEKRFVALWTSPAGAAPAPAIFSRAADLTESELVRAEAADRNLYITPLDAVPREPNGATSFARIRAAHGSNLGLELANRPAAGGVEIVLQLRDLKTGALLRSDRVHGAAGDLGALPALTVRSASRLLDVRWNGSKRVAPETGSPVALAAFQAAQELRKQPNDAGLDRSLADFQQAVEADPRYAIAYAGLAQAYYRLYGLRGNAGVLELAWANAKRAYTLDRHLPQAHAVLALVAQSKGNGREALAEIDRALALDPVDPHLLLSKAQICTRFRQWDQASRAYLQLQRERPNYWLAYQERGVLLHAEGKYPAALESFRAATVVAPWSGLAFSNLGEMYLKLGFLAEAKANFERSLRLNPHDDNAYLSASEAWYAESNYGQAQVCARQAVDLNPAEDQNWLGLADSCDALHRKGRQARAAYGRAAQEAERALATDPTDGARWMRLALYRAKLHPQTYPASLVAKAEAAGASDIGSQLIKARILLLSGRRGRSALDCFRLPPARRASLRNRFGARLAKR